MRLNRGVMPSKKFWHVEIFSFAHIAKFRETFQWIDLARSVSDERQGKQCRLIYEWLWNIDVSNGK